MSRLESRHSEKYVERTRMFEYLSIEREQELLRRWKNTKEPAAAEELISAHLRLVVRLANEFKNGRPIDELISCGNVGLFRALQKFELDKGVRFATYAMFWIRYEIKEYLLYDHSLIKFGTTAAQKKLFYNLRREKTLLGEDGPDLSIENASIIAQRLRVQPKEVLEANGRLAARDTSLNVMLGDSGSSMEWQDLLVDERELHGDTVAEQEVLSRRIASLREALRTLKGRELHIFCERRLRDKPVSLAKLGDQYGISGERIRQIDKAAYRKVRKKVRDLAFA